MKKNSAKQHGYSMETIKKVLTIAKELEKIYITIITMLHVCVSNGNKKIGHVLNVSLMPIMTCANCSKCMHLCYDIKACLMYKGVIPARMRNTVLARYDRDRFFSEIAKKMSRRKKNFYFRWHVSGDILDYDYFCRMVENARQFQNYTIWTYTKNYNIVNQYVAEHGGSIAKALPSNFVVMFSKWDGMPMNNPYLFPVFACKLTNGNKDTTPEQFEKMYKCCGNCDICKETHRGCIRGENTYCDEH